jgi:1-acyl-sn-glycerol-3-phosphate acyltransferase
MSIIAKQSARITAGLRAVLGGFVRMGLFPMDVRGQEHLDALPADRGVIIASHHEWVLDPVYLSLALPRQPTFFAALRAFSPPLWGTYLVAAGHLPADPQPQYRWRNVRSFQEAQMLLRRGDWVALFPAGAYCVTSIEPLPLKAGAAALALMTGAPVLPVGITGTRRVLPWYEEKSLPAWLRRPTGLRGMTWLRQGLRWVPRRHRVNVAFGPSIFTEELANTPENRAKLELQLAKAIAVLVER